MRTVLPSGLWPVMLTAFYEDGSLDWHGIDALTDWYIQTGAAGLFACCASSEMFNLDGAERLALIQRVVERTAGRVPVVATGTFGGPLPEQADFIQQVADLGVQAVVLIPNQLVDAEAPEETLREQLECLLPLVPDLPLGIYECPSPYARPLSPALTRWAAQTGSFLYLKDTTCNPQAFGAKLAVLDESPLRLYNAHTQSALLSLQAGAAGLSPIAANCYPEFFHWLCTHFVSQPTAATAMQQMLTLLEINVSMQYPASAKWLLQRRGLPITTTCRVRTLEQNYNLIAMVESLLATLPRVAEQFSIELQ